MINAYHFTCPASFQKIPNWGLLRNVPAETQILCVGEKHSDLMARYWLYQNLPELAKQGYKTLAVERTIDDQQEVDELLALDSDYPEKLFDTGFDMEVDSYRYTLCAISQYKIMQRAKEVGMDVVCIDEPDPEDMEEFKTFDGMSSRNRHNAERLVNCGKTVLWQGSGHFYDAGESKKKTLPYKLGQACFAVYDFIKTMITNESDRIPDAAEFSMQHLLKEKGIKTYAINLISGHQEFVSDTRRIARNDQQAAKDLRKAFNQNLADTQKSNPVEIEMNEFSKKAGKSLPDRLVIFSQESADWLKNFSRHYYNRDPYAEQALWEALEENATLSYKAKSKLKLSI